MRVLQIGYQQLRRYGHTRVSWTQKLHYGLVKNDHFVHSFSDRDVAAFEAPLRLRDLGRKRANRRLLETAEAVRQASLQMLNQLRAAGETPHPFYWAPFVASGGWN